MGMGWNEEKQQTNKQATSCCIMPGMAKGHKDKCYAGCVIFFKTDCLHKSCSLNNSDLRARTKFKQYCILLS